MFKRFFQRLLTVTFIGTFLVLFIVGVSRIKRQGISDGIQPVGPVPTPTPENTTPVPAETVPPHTSVPATPGTTPTASARATATGTTYRIPWGDVTVSVVVQNGKLVSVDTPDFPDSPPSQYARPILIRQAIAAGSANIQGVSGATYSSLAFKRSLESALASVHL